MLYVKSSTRPCGFFLITLQISPDLTRTCNIKQILQGNNSLQICSVLQSYVIAFLHLGSKQITDLMVSCILSLQCLKHCVFFVFFTGHNVTVIIQRWRGRWRQWRWRGRCLQVWLALQRELQQHGQQQHHCSGKSVSQTLHSTRSLSSLSLSN